MLNLSLNELKLVAKRRDIRDYKSISKERLLIALSESGSVKSATLLSKSSFDDKMFKKIREYFNELRDRLLKPQRDDKKPLLHKNKTKKSISGVALNSKSKINESLFKLEEHLFNFKKYRFHDDFKYRNMEEIYSTELHSM